MARVLVAGLNPAWQKVMEFPSLRAGEVNRARDLLQLASGKGINAAKVLRRLGHEVDLWQIVGGDNGRRCLEACAAWGIRSLHAQVAVETRECLTLLDSEKGQATELIAPFRIPPPDPGPALLAALPDGRDRYAALLLCGTIPPGAPAGLYAALPDRFSAPVILLDSAQPEARALAGRVSGVKVNRREYREWEQAEGKMGETPFLVTDGPREACMLRGGRERERFAWPPLSGVISPIGAGDTVTAGLAHFLLAGKGMAEAFRRALAMGSASCLQRAPAEYGEEDYRRLLPLVAMRAGPLGRGGHG